jgi:zinc transporter ZupT
MALPLPTEDARKAITFWLTVISSTGPILVAIAALWLKANVPSKAEHEALANRVAEHHMALAVMVEASKRDDRQDALLTDHELRLRVVDNRRP